MYEYPYRSITFTYMSRYNVYCKYYSIVGFLFVLQRPRIHSTVHSLVKHSAHVFYNTNTIQIYCTKIVSNFQPNHTKHTDYNPQKKSLTKIRGIQRNEIKYN